MLGTLALGILLLAASPQGNTPDARFDVLVQSDSRGELYPCHCPGAPAGGLSRRSGLFRRLRAGTPLAVTCDGGDLAPDPADSLAPELADLLLQALPLLKYDAVCPGEQDLAWGAGYVLGLAEAAPLVCANLESSIPAVFPVRFVEGKGLRIAVTGFLDPILFYETPGAFEQTDFTLTDPLAALEALADTLAGADAIVVLAHAGLDAILDLAPHLPQVTVWVQGHEPDVAKNPGSVGDAFVLEPGPRSRQVVQLGVTRDHEGVWRQHRYRVWDLKRATENDARIDTMLQKFETEYPAKP